MNFEADNDEGYLVNTIDYVVKETSDDIDLVNGDIENVQNDVPENEIIVENEITNKIKELSSLNREKPLFFSDEVWREYLDCFPWLYYSSGRFLCSFCEEAIKQNKGMISSSWACGNTVKLNAESTKGYNVSKIRFSRHSETHNHILAKEILSQSTDTDYWHSLQSKFPWLERDLLNTRCSLCDTAFKSCKDFLIITRWSLDLNNQPSKVNFSTVQGLERHQLSKNHLFAIKLGTVDKNGRLPNNKRISSINSHLSESEQTSIKRRRKSAPVKSCKESDPALPQTITSHQFDSLQSLFPWLIYRNESSFSCKQCPETNSLIEFDCDSSFISISQNIQDHSNSEVHENSIRGDNKARTTRLQLGIGPKIDYKRLSNGMKDVTLSIVKRAAAVKIEIRPWSCPQCKSHFQHNVSLVEHISLCDYQSTENVRELSCPCNPQLLHFNSITKLDLHAAQEHASQPLFHCYICSDRYNRLLALYDHMLVHHLIVWDPYEAYATDCPPSPNTECIFCGTTVTSNAELTDHYRRSQCKKYLQPAVVVEEIVSDPSKIPSVKRSRKNIAKKVEELFSESNNNEISFKVLLETIGNCTNINQSETVKSGKSVQKILSPVKILEIGVLSENKEEILTENLKPGTFPKEEYAEEYHRSTAIDNIEIYKEKKCKEATLVGEITEEKLKETRASSDETKRSEKLKLNIENTVISLETKKRIKFPTEKIKQNAELKEIKTRKRRLQSEKVVCRNGSTAEKRRRKSASSLKIRHKIVSKKRSEKNEYARKKNSLVNSEQTLQAVNGVRKTVCNIKKETNQETVKSGVSNGPKKVKCSSNSSISDINVSDKSKTQSVPVKSVPENRTKKPGEVSFMDRMKKIRQLKQVITEERREQISIVDKSVAEMNENSWRDSTKSGKVKKSLNCDQYSMDDLKHILQVEMQKRKNHSAIDFHRAIKKPKSVSVKAPKLGGFSCDMCQIKFRTLGTRDNHVTIAHKGTKLFKCRICDTGVSTHLSLRKHAVRYHIDNVSFAVFGKENQVTKHFSYQCHYCSLQFINKQGMNHHVNCIHRAGSDKHKPLIDSPLTVSSPVIVIDDFINKLNNSNPNSGCRECLGCGEMMNNEFELTIHSIDHEREKDSNFTTNQFACPKCCRLFFGQEAKTYLKDHYNIFHLQKPYPSCDDCQSQFQSTWCYYEHKRIMKHCAKRTVEQMKISDPYGPLHDPARLAFVCNRCQCLVAGESAQIRFDQHRVECSMQLPVMV